MLDKKQKLLPDIPDGATVKIIGLGGVGGIVARYGALFLASMRRNVRIILIDGDSFEPKNATRMFFGGFGNKAEVVRDELLDRLKDSGVAIMAMPEFVTPENVERLIREDDIIMMCVDNHSTRKMINGYCSRRKNITLISGGNDGVGDDGHGSILRGTFGNVQIYLRRNDKDASPSLEKYHAEIANPSDKLPTELSCTDLVQSVPQILFANLATASHMLNAMWLYLCGAIHYSEACWDIADGLAKPIPIPAPKLD